MRRWGALGSRLGRLLIEPVTLHASCVDCRWQASVIGGPHDDERVQELLGKVEDHLREHGDPENTDRISMSGDYGMWRDDDG